MGTRLFLKEFLADPVTIGAVAPSGVQLAAQMVTSADIQPGHVVAELGAGTGPMTAELLARHPDNPLVVLEPKPELAATLRDRFPAAHVVEGFAQELPRITAEWGHTPVDRVVSSLPWAIWKQELQEEILQGILAAMAPDGRMVTFTYWHAQPLPAAKRFKRFLEDHFRTVERSPVAWKNLPPAFVFVCDR
ncbi:MAG: methyltransferase [Alphaproteobacteria bacterium]|nr:methyltransferase [Alphaproteobacteria bacterium]MCB9694680.1 methyltransferase [Alphaproteobacteria bacterium]